MKLVRGKGYYSKAQKAARAKARGEKRAMAGVSSLFKRKYVKSGKYSGRARARLFKHLPGTDALN